jgi:hypothetical protein
MCFTVLRLAVTDLLSSRKSLTLDKALKLLGVDAVPGGNKMAEVMITWLEHLITKKGEDWVVSNRKRLVDKLKVMSEER